MRLEREFLEASSSWIEEAVPRNGVYDLRRWSIGASMMYART